MGLVEEIQRYFDLKEEWRKTRDRLETAYNRITPWKGEVNTVKKTVEKLLDGRDWCGNTKDEFRDLMDDASSAIKGYWKEVDNAHDAINREKNYAQDRVSIFFHTYRSLKTEYENLIN